MGLLAGLARLETTPMHGPRGLELSFLVALMVKTPPAVQETQVRSLGREDPLEKVIATHSSMLACRLPRTEEPGGLQFMGLQRIRLD